MPHHDLTTGGHTHTHTEEEKKEGVRRMKRGKKKRGRREIKRKGESREQKWVEDIEGRKDEE